MAETFEDVLTRHDLAGTDLEFRQRLLSRMEQDCNYWLGNGGGADKHLWAGEPREQLSVMKALWLSLPEGENRRLLSLQDIEAYALRMGVDLEALPVDGSTLSEKARQLMGHVTDALEGQGFVVHTYEQDVTQDETIALEIDFFADLGERGSWEVLNVGMFANEADDPLTWYEAFKGAVEGWFQEGWENDEGFYLTKDEAESIQTGVLSDMAESVWQAAREADANYSVLKDHGLHNLPPEQRSVRLVEMSLECDEYLKADKSALSMSSASEQIGIMKALYESLSSSEMEDTSITLDVIEDYAGRMEVGLEALPERAEKAQAWDVSPFQNFDAGKWGVRFVLPGENYGVNGACVYEQEDADKFGDGLPLVEFYDKSQDPAKFPVGQFVARYYLDTLCRPTDYTPRIDQMTMLELDGGVPGWTISGEDMEVVGENLMGMYRRACESRGEAQGVAKEDKGYSLDSACKAASEAKDSRVGERTSAGSRDEIR